MNKREIDLLNRACQMTGIDSKTISPENPFSKSGKVAQMLQVAVAEIDPEQSARWRVDAGGGLSVATWSEMQSGEQLSQAAMQDLWQHDPAFVVDVQRQQQTSEERMLKSLDEGAAATRLRNKTREMGGNVDRAREALKAEAERDEQLKAQREESQRHAQQLNQRLEQKRQQDRQMAGGIL